MKRQQASAGNVVAYTAEELFKMGKAQFTKIVSAFEHSMAGSAQEKLRQRSDLEAMVEQIEQQSLYKIKPMHCCIRGIRVACLQTCCTKMVLWMRKLR